MNVITNTTNSTTYLIHLLSVICVMFEALTYPTNEEYGLGEVRFGGVSTCQNIGENSTVVVVYSRIPQTSVLLVPRV